MTYLVYQLEACFLAANYLNSCPDSEKTDFSILSSIRKNALQSEFHHTILDDILNMDFALRLMNNVFLATIYVLLDKIYIIMNLNILRYNI